MASSRIVDGLLALYCLLLAYALFAIWSYVESVRATHPVLPHLQDLSLPLASSLIFVCAHRAFQVFCRPLASAVIPKKDKWSELVYHSKLTRFGSAIFKFLFFTFFSGYSYAYALADAEWTPPSLFGRGSTTKCWGDAMMLPMGQHLDIFYKVALSYHASELVFQFVYEREKPDFAEMLAHHATTCFLVLASFLGNFVRIGSLVLFLHYVSDIPVYGAKIFVDTKQDVLTVLNLLGMLGSWGYLRLYCFPRYIISSTLFESVKERAEYGDVAYFSFNAGLILLVLLQIYWYKLFIQMGLHVLLTGQQVDKQANLHAMDSKNGETDADGKKAQ
mmetsp:Transcript_135919/g.253970  ORF Transcript_135919/g.253970 Transcript_135919/m.253970 type:complete len:332 (+) Transcript_135919:65-1060(+)